MRTDKELLDFLQSLNDKANYTGLCVLRDSRTGRGWRLYETERRIATESFTDVREAIADYMDFVEIRENLKGDTKVNKPILKDGNGKYIPNIENMEYMAGQIKELEAKIEVLRKITDIKDPEQHFEQIMSAKVEFRTENKELKAENEKLKAEKSSNTRTINTLIENMDTEKSEAFTELKAENEKLKAQVAEGVRQNKHFFGEDETDEPEAAKVVLKEDTK